MVTYTVLNFNSFVAEAMQFRMSEVLIVVSFLLGAVLLGRGPYGNLWSLQKNRIHCHLTLFK